MPRVVALDVGDATIGVAASDELKITSNPVKTIMRTPSVKADLRQLEELFQELDAELIVVGLPVYASGDISPQAKKTLEFKDRLARRLKIPVVTWDETYSTKEADGFLIEADISRKKRRKIIDKMAAAVILQEYIDSLAHTIHENHEKC